MSRSGADINEDGGFFPSCQQILNQERRDYFPSLGLTALVPGIIVGYDVEIYPVLRLDFPVLSPAMTRTEEAGILQHRLMLFRFDSEV